MAAEEYIAWQPPISPTDLYNAADYLQRKSLLCGFFDYSQKDTYNPGTYIVQRTAHGTTTCILIDRNVFSLIKDFALGRRLEADKGKLVGAFMTFAIVCDIQIEPSIALYEYAEHNGSDAARRDLKVFRHADNIDVQTYVRLLRGEICRLPEKEEYQYSELPPPCLEDYTRPLRNWQFNYPLILKIAELQLTPLAPIKRMHRFLSWMWQDFLFSGPATIFGSIFLNPARGGHKRMIKGLTSLDPGVRMAGIRNACWDLCLVQEWLRHLGEQATDNRLWLLASADRALMDMAKRIGISQSAVVKLGQEELSKRPFIEVWGEEAGCELYTYYRTLLTSQDSKTRACYASDFNGGYCQNLIAELEQRLFKDHQ